jgi:hypothetical protein
MLLPQGLVRTWLIHFCLRYWVPRPSIHWVPRPSIDIVAGNVSCCTACWPLPARQEAGQPQVLQQLGQPHPVSHLPQPTSQASCLCTQMMAGSGWQATLRSCLCHMTAPRPPLGGWTWAVQQQRQHLLSTEYCHLLLQQNWTRQMPIITIIMLTHIQAARWVHARPSCAEARSISKYTPSLLQMTMALQ